MMKHRIKILFCAVFLFLSSAPTNAQSLIRDTEIETVMKEWGAPIFKAAELNPDAVNLILIQNDAINAFVAGGSNIFFYTGLISKTENPGEVIGVMAHETGHITGGHLITTRDALERASYESIISAILGVGIAIASGDTNAIPAVGLGGTSIAQRRFLAHSRVQESSADQAALSLLEKAEINPTGLATFMDKLKAEIYVPESQQSEYIQTHPLVSGRIEVLLRGVEQSAYKNKPYPQKWVEQHARIKAKLIAFTNPGQIPWIFSDTDTSIAADYARAIASYRNNNVQLALEQMDNLLRREPKNPYFLELKGQMLVDFGRVSEAVPYYRQALDILPKAPLLRIALAHALIESAKNNEPALLNEAIDNLERAVRKETRSTKIHRLLATAYGRTGQESFAKIHLAEEALLQRRMDYARQNAEGVLAQEEEGSNLWIKAKDIISFIETM